MKDLVQEGRKLQETFKTNVVEGTTIKKTDDFHLKEDSGNGRPTVVLSLSSSGWEKVSDMFDNMGRPKSSEIKGMSDGGFATWELHVQPIKVYKVNLSGVTDPDGEMRYKIYGVSGDYTFGNAPTYYQKRLAGNKKSAIKIYNKFIEKFLK